MSKTLAFGLIAVPTAFLLLTVLVYIGVLELQEDTSYWKEALSALFGLLVGITLVGYSIRLLQRTKRIAAAAIGLYLITAFAVISILAFAADFKRFGLTSTFDTKYSFKKSDYLYFSAITWTTVGYGDFIPSSDESRLLAAEEALFGYVYMAVYIGYMLNLLTFFTDYLPPQPGQPGAPSQKRT